MKKYSTTTTLVIVESPAKCKKIENYLGSGYKCIASFGHLRELTSLANVDIANNFNATYTNAESKGKQIALLKSEIDNITRSGGSVLLATDDDREGEAIAWHICMLFGLNPEKTDRIIFHEITASALQHAVQNPTKINMNLVKSQQTRQILDLLVGFKVSPILWKYIANQNLSAGRCQTPALKLIYDNKADIERNKGKQMYDTIGYFCLPIAIPFSLNKHHETEDKLVDFLEATSEFNHTYSCTQPTQVFKQPPQPLTTSRLQQAASNEMHISPKDTMKLCQSLYEAGYITYMRTDSQTYCSEFLDTVKKYIVKAYSEEYVSSTKEDAHPNEKKEKKGKKNSHEKNTEAPHEAIRPTNISLSELPDQMDSKERKLYKLIWQTTLSSCMSPAIFHSVKATIQGADDSIYTNISEQASFLGWMAITQKSIAENKEYLVLRNAEAQGKYQTNVRYTKIQSKLTLKERKLHYTEAHLVKLLEENGIGRPSTFSSLVDKIQERGYVKKQDIAGKTIVCKDYELEGTDIFETETKREFGNEKGKLVIQPLGTLVIDFLEKYFAELFQYEYTKQMEDCLDSIARGIQLEKNPCVECLDRILSLTEQIERTISGEKKVEIKIDEDHTYMIGKHGPVIKCIGPPVTFISARKDIDIHALERGEYTLLDILAEPKAKTEYNLGPYEGKDIILKRGKFGIYLSWGEETKTLKCFGNRPIENINYSDVIEILEKDGNIIREITPNMVIRKSKHGDYIYFKTQKMKKPQFFSLRGFEQPYITCDLSLLLTWIKNTHSI